MGSKQERPPRRVQPCVPDVSCSHRTRADSHLSQTIATTSRPSARRRAALTARGASTSEACADNRSSTSPSSTGSRPFPSPRALSARVYRSLTRSDLRSFGMIDNDEHLAKWEPDDSNLATLEHRIEGIFLPHMAKEGLTSFQHDLLIMASLFWDAKFLRWVRDLLAILSLSGPD